MTVLMISRSIRLSSRLMGRSKIIKRHVDEGLGHLDKMRLKHLLDMYDGLAYPSCIESIYPSVIIGD